MPRTVGAPFPLTLEAGITTLGLVGAGGIAPAHLTAWRDLGVEVLLAPRSGAADLVAQVGHGRVAPDLEHLVEQCDVVDLCSPTASHPDLVRRAAAAGRHVICEKPLALTAPVARSLVADCAAQGVRLLVAHVVRYFPLYAAAHAQLREPEAGAVVSARYLRRGARPERAWFLDAGQSGGVLLDLMVHDLDQARWNAGEVTEVRAVSTGRLDDPARPVTTEVTLWHVGGAVSTVTGVWDVAGTAFETAFEVTTDAGFVAGSHCASTRSAAAVVAAESPYLTQARDLLAAVVDGATPRVTADDAVAAVALADAAAASLRVGGTVRPLAV